VADSATARQLVGRFFRSTNVVLIDAAADSLGHLELVGEARKREIEIERGRDSLID